MYGLHRRTFLNPFIPSKAVKTKIQVANECERIWEKYREKIINKRGIKKTEVDD